MDTEGGIESVAILSPKSEQHQFSPNKINTWTKETGYENEENDH